MSIQNTRVLQAKTARSRQSIHTAARAIREGRLVVFPTETVYGIGADALNARAVRSIFTAKGRPSDNPLIVHISDLSMLQALVASIPPQAEKLIRAFWPGPLTILFPVAKGIPRAVTAGLRTIAIRMPAHPVARALIAAAGTPIAAPSANISGRPSPTQAQHAWEDLRGRVAYILDGGETAVGVESTVVDVRAGIDILRLGGITAEDIARIAGKTPHILNQPRKGRVRSPGQKYTHYAPRTPVAWVRLHGRDGITMTRLLLARYTSQHRSVALIAPPEYTARFRRVHRFIPFGHLHNPESQAHDLFTALRTADAASASIIIICGVEERGIGQATAERLERASTKIYTSTKDTSLIS